jgi:hypothetical protein
VESKAAVKSLGVTAPIVSIVVIVLGMFGIDVSADLTGFADKIAAMIDSGVVIVGIVVGIYGRVRASARITGVFRASKPLND